MGVALRPATRRFPLSISEAIASVNNLVHNSVVTPQIFNRIIQFLGDLLRRVKQPNGMRGAAVLNDFIPGFSAVGRVHEQTFRVGCGIGEIRPDFNPSLRFPLDHVVDRASSIRVWDDLLGQLFAVFGRDDEIGAALIICPKHYLSVTFGDSRIPSHLYMKLINGFPLRVLETYRV